MKTTYRGSTVQRTAVLAVCGCALVVLAGTWILPVRAQSGGTLNGQLWYAIGGAPQDTSEGHINSDASNPTLIPVNSGYDSQAAMGLDLPAGFYFSTSTDGLNIEARRISDGVRVDELQIGDAASGPATQDLINTLAVDPIQKYIYVGKWGQDLAQTGIVRVSYNPATGALDHTQAIGPTQTRLVNGTQPGGITDPRAMDLETDGIPGGGNDFLYYTDNDNGYNIAPFVPTNGVYRIDLNNPAAGTTRLSSQVQFPTTNVDTIGPLAVDTAHGLIYFETHALVGSAAKLWWMPIAGGTATQMTVPAPAVLSITDYPTAGLTVDPQTHQLYISVQSNLGQGFTQEKLYQGQLSADGHSITSWVNITDISVLDGHVPDDNAHVHTTTFNLLPVLTVAATATHAVEQGGFVDLTASNTSTDADGDHYAGATVQITGGTFSSNETSANDDHLSVLDGGTNRTSGLVTGTSITVSYDIATEKLTLTGYDTIANYNMVLGNVRYNTTGDNPTNYGNNPTRTISWTMSDGSPNVPFGGQNSGTTTITIDAVNDPPVNVVPGAKTVNEDTTLSVTGIVASNVDPDADPANQNITVTLGVLHGTLDVRTDVVGGVAPAGVSGDVTGTVTLTATRNAINATLAAANGLVYAPAANYFGADTLTVTANDQGHTPSPALQDADTVGITVTPIADTPSITSATTKEDTQSASGLVISRNAADGAEVTHFKITGITSGTLFKNDGVTQITNGTFITFAEGNLGLKFTPGLNLYSPGTTFGFTVQAGTDGVGGGLSPTATATVTVDPVADTPGVTNATTFPNTQTTSGLVLSKNLVDGAEVTHFRITNIANGVLYKNNGTTVIAGGSFILLAEGTAGLKFTPNNGIVPGSFDVQAAIGASTVDISPAATATITVNKYTTSTAITSHVPNPSDQFGSVTVTATVTPTDGTSPPPDGLVNFTFGDGSGSLPATCSPASGNTCSAVLAHSYASAGVFSIVASYAGGTLHQGSTSGAASQTVNACTSNPVVTSNGDSGAGTLRQALLDVCANPGDNVITFAAGFVGPITLHSVLEPTRDVVIRWTDTGRLEITRDAAFGSFRIFHIAAGPTVSLERLEITNGSPDFDPFLGWGGGILNEGTLTIVGSVIRNNTGAGPGAGIANSAFTSGTTATLTLQDSTVSANQTPLGGGLLNWAADPLSTASMTILNSLVAGNSADDVAGVFNDGSSGNAILNVTNSTISGNVAGGDTGGLYNNSGVVTLTNATVTANQSTNFFENPFLMPAGINNPFGTLTLRNTIVARNAAILDAESVWSDVWGEVDPLSATNLIGTGDNLTGLVNGDNGNQIGTTASPIDPMLGPLADNGGPTRTHALLRGSPAIDRGDNSSATAAGLTTDQRGTGFNRSVYGATTFAAGFDIVDIGAVEAQPTVGDITDRTIFEEGTAYVQFYNGDAPAGFSLGAHSSNQILVPDANLGISGLSATVAQLSVSPASDQSGSATITVTASATVNGTLLTSSTSFVVNVTAINDAPTIDPISNPPAIPEDSGQQTVNLTGITAGGGESQTVTVSVTSDNPSLFASLSTTYSSSNGTGTVVYTPAANASGSATITVTVQDDGGTANGGFNTATRTFLVVVNAVPDPPSVTNATTAEDTQTTSGLAVSRNPVDGNEVQFFKVTNIQHGTLYFADGLAEVPEGSFFGLFPTPTNFKFTPAPNFFGTASFDIQASLTHTDAGLGGPVVTATITVTPVADAPSVSPALPTTLAQVQTSALVLTPHPADAGGVTHLKITNIQHGTLFQQDGTTPIVAGQFITTAEGAAGVKFTPADGFVGSASFDVRASLSNDDAGLGGLLTVPINVAQHATTITLTSADPNPSDKTQPITVVYSVVSADGGPTPTGTVQVLISGEGTSCTGTVAQGQCTMSPQLAGNKDITAGYFGDAINSASGTASPLAHTVNACTFDPLVTSTADSGPGSLREALATGCYGSNVILATGGGPDTITLTTGPLTIAKNFSVLNGVTGGVRIDGNHASSVFVVQPGVVASIDGVTVMNGSAASGGGIDNHGTLTLTNSTVSGNTATVAGAGIANSGTLTVVTSTISGNTVSNGSTPVSGGGISSDTGVALTLTHVTITNNSAGSASGSQGGGIAIGPNTTIANSIVAGNTAPASADVSGAAPTLLGNNMLSGNPMLGPLQDNGGWAFTHMPLPGSPVLDAGDNAVTASAGLTLDQRRFARVLDAADADAIQTVDLGAVEADPVIQVLTDQVTAEDVPLQYVFNIGDGTEPFGGLFTVTSSNQALVSNGGGHLVISGTGPTRTLTITPNANANGTTTIDVSVRKNVGGPLYVISSSSFVLTVTGVNDQPTLNPIADRTLAEDPATQLVTLNGIGAGGGETQVLTLTATSDNTALIPNPAVTYTSPSSGGSLLFKPLLDAFGTATITVTVTDDLGSSIVRTFTVTVSPVADDPSISSATTNEDTQTTSGLVITRNAADGAEVTHFKILSVTGGTLFYNDGTTPLAPGTFITIAEGAAGLRFTPAADSIAMGQVAVRAATAASDGALGGSVAIGNIFVVPIADAPSVTPATTTEDTQTTSGLVISRNAADGAEVTHFRITSIANGTLFQNDGTTPIASGAFITFAQGNAGLKFTPAPNFFGAGSFVVQGVAGGGGAGASTIVSIAVSAVADTPSITNASTFVNTQTTSGLVVAPNAGDGAEVTHVKIAAVTGGTLFKTDGTTAIAAGSFITIAEGAAGLKFTPTTNSVATGHVTIQASRLPADAGLGGSPVTAAIVVTCPTVTIAPSTIPAAVVGASYSQTFTQSGAIGAITFSLTGTLPSGLTFDAATATISGTPTGAGSYPITVTATPSNGCGAVSANYTLLVGGGRAVMTGAGQGGGPHVRRFNAIDGSVPESGALSSFFAFDPSFAGGVRVAEGDVNFDGEPDYITAAGPGGTPTVRIFDGATGTLLKSFLAFEPSFTGGVYVAAGDVNGDGFADVIAGSGEGRPGEVKVFSGRDGSLLRDTAVFAPAFTGGVRVAAGDVNGDGFADLIAGTGPGPASTVTILSGADLSMLRTFSPYGVFPGGVFVAAGDVTGDGFADVITGADAGGGPHVQVFDGVTGVATLGFFAFDVSFSGGVRVAAGDVTGDGKADIIVGAGPGGTPEVRVFDGATATLISTQMAYDPLFPAGIYVATAVPINRMSIDLPSPFATVSGPFAVAGWAFEENANDTGIDAIHVWAIPIAGGAPQFLGAALLGFARPDIGAMFGPKYANAGYWVEAPALPAGTYDVYVFAHSTVSGTFNMTRVVRIVVTP